MAAEVVSPELRVGVLGARSRGVRCLRANVADAPPSEERRGDEGRGEQGGPTHVHSLVLAQATPGLPDTSLEKEFQRCVAEALPKQPPCLLLFRTDQRENVEGCRWLLVVWLPSSAPEADRVACVRSRGLLAQLVPHPHFLRELFATGPHELTWRAACDACAGSSKEAAARRVQHPRLHKLAPGGTASIPVGPVVPTLPAVGLLARFGRREDPCVRLTLTSPFRAGRGGKASAPALEAKVVDSRSPAHLAKAVLPPCSCYFAMHVRDDLAFIHWCPESMTSKDTARISDDARHAVLKAAVLSFVLGVVQPPHPRVLRVSAREPQEILDSFNRAAAGEAAPSALPPRVAVRAAEEARSWPAPGGVADWPDHWPPDAVSVAMPASLLLPQRAVPPWRGGGRHGVISVLANTPGSIAARTKVQKLVTHHFGDMT
mmetsp:Transcript_48304/g.151857  ORF Transcript_48304/g.151857 Transcript_48304/m.151857 type:complete len:431 (-) Transcript_48304:94-1386(-)